MANRTVTANDLWRTPEDLDVLMTVAVRYALGRQTYIVVDVCRIVREHMEKLSERARYMVIFDIEEARDRGRLGGPTDRRRWLWLLEDLKKMPNDETA